MVHQQQFLDVIDRDEAEARFHAAIRLQPLGPEPVALAEALGRTLATDVIATVDVPSFDRSNYDGFAVRASDTTGAHEESPQPLQLLPEIIATAMQPKTQLAAGQAVSIATGAMLPRGADAVVMVEHTDPADEGILVYRAVPPGNGIAFAGTDVAAGEIVLRQGDRLSSRETGVLAAIGVDELTVWARPRVGILSTGDEIIAPGSEMQPGMVYDSNARILADAVTELGGQPVPFGIVRDDVDEMRQRFQQAVATCDLILLSGGTSKGAGDLSYRVVQELQDPGIVAHGVALKPGKPICLAATQGKPVVVLPGFPTSAVFTFHEFVAPVIRALAGLPQAARDTTTARMAVKVNSEIGRTEYLLVGLVQGPATAPDEAELAAYPMGKGSGSVTTFSRADGFVTIDRHQEIVEADQLVEVQLLGSEHRIADLVVIGSHCVGLDYLLSQLQQQGIQTKFMAVGSSGGLAAAKRGECDVAGIHLLDAETNRYNLPFLVPGLELIPGYTRQQGVVFRTQDERFQEATGREAIERVKADPECLMVNRNRGSGTRILIDRLLGETQPPGYAVQARNHNAVAAAVAQGRADWGVAIQSVATQAGLGFLPLLAEQYDFVVPEHRRQNEAVQALQALLASTRHQESLAQLGLTVAS